MENKLLKEYLGEFNEDSDVSIIIANPKDRKMYKSEIMFMIAPEDEEVAGLLQKIYQGHEFDRDHMKKELGDCLWMIAEACEALGLDMEDVMRTNIDKLKARYPEGFSADRSLHRAEGDV